MTLYNLRSATDGYRITKFDDDFVPEEGSSYLVSESACECPAGHRFTCRHRQMLPVFINCGMVDKHQFWCFETKAWVMGPVDFNEDEAEAFLGDEVEHVAPTCEGDAELVEIPEPIFSEEPTAPEKLRRRI